MHFSCDIIKRIQPRMLSWENEKYIQNCIRKVRGDDKIGRPWVDGGKINVNLVEILLKNLD
jgi:hypothetical protein